MSKECKKLSVYYVHTCTHICTQLRSKGHDDNCDVTKQYTHSLQPACRYISRLFGEIERIIEARKRRRICDVCSVGDEGVFVCTEGVSCGGGEKSAGSPPALTKAA